MINIVAATCTVCNVSHYWSRGQNNKQQNNTPRHKTDKQTNKQRNNLVAGCLDPVNIELSKGAGLLQNNFPKSN